MTNKEARGRLDQIAAEMETAGRSGDTERCAALFAEKVAIHKTHPEAARMRSVAVAKAKRSEPKVRQPTDDVWWQEYKRYIASDEWRTRREVAIRKAGERCQVCNMGGALDVHHRTYVRLGSEMEDDLTVLCRTCHELFTKHNRMRRVA
jgi:5-methylcytosine-specific restriction endonuclease McrA